MDLDTVKSRLEKLNENKDFLQKSLLAGFVAVPSYYLYLAFLYPDSSTMLVGEAIKYGLGISAFYIGYTKFS